MNEKTETNLPTGLEEAPSFGAPVESSGRPTRRPEELRGADLKGQDLMKVEGLLPEHLAGADLTGAKLPERIDNFPALDQVAAISSEARKIFIGLLAACVYSWLVIGTTTDVALILNTASSPLPIINTPIPIAGFYVVGAVLLAAVYCYFHFYLQRLWRTLAILPAVFPDGTALDDKTDPWLLTNLVRTQFARLSASPPPLARLENLLSVVLAWWLVPVTLIALWARYLPAHDIGGLAWLALLLASTTFFGRHTFRLARATLRGVPKAAAQDLPRRPLLLMFRVARHLRPGEVILTFLMPFIVIISLSLSALWQPPRNAGGQGTAEGKVVVFSLTEPGRSLQEVEPTPAKLLNFIGIRTYADLREVNVAERPNGWDGKDWSKVKRVDLRGRNLTFADAESTFLANADLRGATLSGANLNEAQLQGANLEEARLQGANLQEAQLQGAGLIEAQLQGADLSFAQLQGATLLRAQLQGAILLVAQLQGATLQSAEFQGADLRGALLQGANLSMADLRGADLSRFMVLAGFKTRLQGADLRDAQLQGADLRDAQLQGANLRKAMIWRTRVNNALWDLADLRGSTAEPMTDSEIDALIEAASKGIRDEARLIARLNDALRTEKRPGRPHFPKEWRSKPNVMFAPGDPKPQPFDWGPGKWSTEQAYDEDLATLFGNLACGGHSVFWYDVAGLNVAHMPEAQAQGLAHRALVTSHSIDGAGRVWPGLFAKYVTGDGCPPGKGLPEEMRRQLEELATRDETTAAKAPGPS